MAGQWDDSRYVKDQYATDEGLRIRIDTHRHYGTGPKEDIFDRITDLMAARVRPRAVLDLGAGTGNWYRAIRRRLGDEVHYTAIDQSAGMVERLGKVVQGDANARVQAADILDLPWDAPRFDWVGAHFMLYHVSDIPRALESAWALVRPGGILAAATNGVPSYRELFDLARRAAAYVGAHVERDEVVSRFHLDNGATFFPASPERVVWQGGFRFPSPEPALRYLASGPMRAHLGGMAEDPDRVEKALAWVGQEIDRIVAEQGAFTVHSEAGVFVLQKPEL